MATAFYAVIFKQRASPHKKLNLESTRYREEHTIS
jgi:hypothetical protein